MKSTVIFYCALAFSYKFVASHPYSVEPRKYSGGYQTRPDLESSYQANAPRPNQNVNQRYDPGVYNRPLPTHPGIVPAQQPLTVNRQNYFQSNQQHYPEGPPNQPKILNSQYANQQTVPVQYPHYQLNENRPVEVQQHYRLQAQASPQIVNTEPFIPAVPPRDAYPSRDEPLKVGNERYLHATAPQGEEKVIPIIKPVPIRAHAEVLPTIAERYLARAIHPVEQLPEPKTSQRSKVEQYLAHPRIKEVLASTKHQRRYLVIHPDGRVEHVDNLNTVSKNNPNYFLVHAGDVVANQKQHQQAEKNEKTISLPHLPVATTKPPQKQVKQVNELVQEDRASLVANPTQIEKQHVVPTAAPMANSQIKPSEFSIDKEILPALENDGLNNAVEEAKPKPQPIDKEKGSSTDDTVAKADRKSLNSKQTPVDRSLSENAVPVDPGNNESIPTQYEKFVNKNASANTENPYLTPGSVQENKTLPNNTAVKSPVLLDTENNLSNPPQENQTSINNAAATIVENRDGPQGNKNLDRITSAEPLFSADTKNENQVVPKEPEEEIPVVEILEENPGNMVPEKPIKYDPENNSPVVPLDDTIPESSVPVAATTLDSPDSNPVSIHENNETDINTPATVPVDPKEIHHNSNTSQPNQPDETNENQGPDKNASAAVSDPDTSSSVPPLEIKSLESGLAPPAPVTVDQDRAPLSSSQPNKTPENDESPVVPEAVNLNSDTPVSLQVIENPVNNSTKLPQVQENRVGVTRVPGDVDKYILEEASISEPSKDAVSPFDTSKKNNKPVIWFRTTDPNFWDKLSNNDSELDVVFFFQIHNQPKIEKDVKTTLYPNGTIVEVLTETTWDFEGDEPKITKTTKVTNPDDL